MIFLSKPDFKTSPLVLFSCFLLLGCNGYQYVSSPYYVPVNTDSSKLSCSFSFNNYQLGYSFKKISLFTTGYYRNNQHGIHLIGKENGGEYFQSDKHYEFALGATHFNAINKWLSYELVAGTGLGSAEYSNCQDLFSDYEFDLNSKRLALYIQPNFTLKQDNFFDFSIFSKISYNRYFDIQSDWKFGDKGTFDTHDGYFAHRKYASLYFIEPGFQIRLGFKNLKWLCSYSYCTEITGANIEYRNFTLHFGIFFRLGKNESIP
jgi:hypothetical protein